MAKVKLVIDSRFNNKSILEVLNYFHLGKEKIKKVKFFLNGKKPFFNVKKPLNIDFCHFLRYNSTTQ